MIEFMRVTGANHLWWDGIAKWEAIENDPYLDYRRIATGHNAPEYEGWVMQYPSQHWFYKARRSQWIE